MNQKLTELAQETFVRFPLDERVIQEIWQRGWRFYVFPNNVYDCHIGGRVFNEEKHVVVRDNYPPSNIVSFFHELLHIQHDQENGLTDPNFKQLGIRAIKTYPSPKFSDYDHDCIEKEARRLARLRKDLLTFLHNLHTNDREGMVNPIKNLDPIQLMIDEKVYGPKKILAIYLGRLRPPSFEYDYGLIT